MKCLAYQKKILLILIWLPCISHLLFEQSPSIIVPLVNNLFSNLIDEIWLNLLIVLAR